MKNCNHDPPRCQIGQPFVSGRDCRQCWLFHHDQAYRHAWGGHSVANQAVAVVEQNTTLICGIGEPFAAARHKRKCWLWHNDSRWKERHAECPCCGELAPGPSDGPDSNRTINGTIISENTYVGEAAAKRNSAVQIAEKPKPPKVCVHRGHAVRENGEIKKIICQEPG